MSKTEIREYLHKYIDIADERFLTTVFEISQMNKSNLDDKKSYYRAGKLISKKQLYLELKEAESEIAKGNFSAIEDFVKEADKWS